MLFDPLCTAIQNVKAIVEIAKSSGPEPFPLIAFLATPKSYKQEQPLFQYCQGLQL